MSTIRILLHPAAGLNFLLPDPMLGLDLRRRKEGLSVSGFGHLETIVQGVAQPGHLSMVFRTSCIGITISTGE